MVQATAYTPNQWILDSGATHHLTSDLSNLALHQPYHGGDEVAIADGSGLAITHTGSTLFPTPSKSLALNNILCVPSVHKNLISVYRLCNTNRVSVEFFPAHFQVKDLNTGVRLLQGRTRNELYEWPWSSLNPTASYVSYPDTKATLTQWHRRLGHPSSSILKNVVSQFSLPCFEHSSSAFPCNDCLLNKTHKLPFHETTIRSTKPLQYVFSDVWQSPILSSQNYKYYLVLVDHYTRYTWLYPLTAKSQVKDIFISFKPLVENRFQTKIQTLFSDNGGEFLALRSFLATHGISHLTTPPHTPELNGLSERKHRHIVETGLSLLSAASLPLTFWPQAFATSVFLINRMPTPVLLNQSPFQKLFQTPPNYLKLRTFGCLCYPWLRPYAPNKLENRSLPCVFIGYSLTQSAYLCLEPVSGRVYVSRHVRFNETEFPSHSLTKPTSPTPSQPPTVPYEPHTVIPAPSLIHSPQTAVNNQTSACDTSSPVHVPAPTPPTGSSAPATTGSPGPVLAPLLQPTVPSPVPVPEVQPPPRHSMTTRSRNNIVKPTSKYNLNVELQSDPHWIPSTWQHAIKHERWRKAMSREFNSTNENHTWDLVEATRKMNIVGCRWVFTIKYNPDGSIDRYKARIVAKGFHQQPGIDFNDTFSPVIKSTTIRLVLGLAVSSDWPIRQIDVNTAFLQGHLDEEVFMCQPPGFTDSDRPSHVCRLRKAIYGLKQAPRAWYSELKSFLLSVGFQNSLADTSLFILRHEGKFVYLLVYIDDILVTGTSTDLVQQVIDALAAKFSIKDMGHLSYFLGIEATRTPQGLHLMQRNMSLTCYTRLICFMLSLLRPLFRRLPSSP